MAAKIEALGRFELPAIKVRKKSPEHSRTGVHEPKKGASQPRSRLNKHFRNSVKDWIQTGDLDD